MQPLLMNGDCLEMMSWIPDGSVDMVLCDLPYGTTQNGWDSLIPFPELWAEYLRVGKDNCAFVLTAQPPFDKVLGCSNLTMLKYEWIWEKTKATGHLNAKKQPMKAHENILVFYGKQATYNPQMAQGEPYTWNSKRSSSSNYGKAENDSATVNNGTRYPRSVIQMQHVLPTEVVHPTQKPVALMEYLIRTYTNPGDTVLDNTMGSGTTGVAAVNTGREFIGIERDDKYFAIAQQRIDIAVNSLVP